MNNALCVMGRLVENLISEDKENPIQIAMPLIGCGLDGLEWEKVKQE